MQRLAVTVTAALVALTALHLFPVPSFADAVPTPPYTNHTVGGPTGWLFDAKKNASAADYSAWAKSQSFFLGDFLIFKTNSNMSVIQTYNKSAYVSCDSSSDSSEWSNGGEAYGVAEVIPVPLTEEGGSYFFSDADDGVQCAKGMRFSIDVGKGRGLPSALAQPPPPPYVEPLQPPPPDSAGTVVGGSPQGESFYTGGAAQVGVFWGGFLLAALFFV